MGKLSTHVLDTAHGKPAAGMAYVFYAVNGAALTEISHGRTNADGRADAPLLAGDAVKRGTYRLSFAVAEYFRAQAVQLPDPPFIDVVNVDFGISQDGGSYHVPLVCSPWSYSTYRGS
jgi:5-hydroxyisourate hydrolase